DVDQHGVVHGPEDVDQRADAVLADAQRVHRAARGAQHAQPGGVAGDVVLGGDRRAVVLDGVDQLVHTRLGGHVDQHGQVAVLEVEVDGDHARRPRLGDGQGDVGGQAADPG